MSRYKKSQELLHRALRSIPLGTQTFSKSKTQFPEGASPFYLERGEGCHVWDVDGNEYIDLISGLGAVTLGYRDPDVDAAVIEQLKQGVTFSLPTSIEIDVAEKIIELLPCAEMVRFGKNGSDATTAAIRLARAYTGREEILVGGYHGWHDWYIGSTTKNLGVPQSTQELTHRFNFNHFDSLQKVIEKKPNAFAAIIFEPLNFQKPEQGFLEKVREITEHYKIVLIFDEVVSGFRCDDGGAQAYYNVIPDLTTVGKGMANGFPISAVVGKRKIMRYAEKIFFSFTFGSEAVSLTAAKATLNKIKTHHVTRVLRERGGYLMERIKQLLLKHELTEIIVLGGYESCSTLLFRDAANYPADTIKTLFMQEMMQRGILTLGVNLLNYAHSDADLDKALTVYDQVFAILKNAIQQQNLLEQLKCEPLVPLFKVREDL